MPRSLLRKLTGTSPTKAIATMAATNKCLAQSNKSPHRANATKERARESKVETGLGRSRRWSGA
jgi:hypothetical protein